MVATSHETLDITRHRHPKASLTHCLVCDTGSFLYGASIWESDPGASCLSAIGNLAGSLQSAGRTAQAIPMDKQVVSDCAEIPLAEHRDNIRAPVPCESWKSK